MDVIEAVREYIKKITDIKGMKVLLVDKHTTGIISVVYSQTEILQREVYLVDKLEKKGREKFPNLIAVCFIKPTVESIQDLADELRDPKYKEYYICKLSYFSSSSSFFFFFFFHLLFYNNDWFVMI